MILLRFPHPLTLLLDDGSPLPLAGSGSDRVVSPDQVFLALPEQHQQLERLCREHGLPLPAAVGIELARKFFPRPLAALWQLPAGSFKGRTLTVCLLNGAAGGLGDGIMAAPALETLSRLLQEHLGAARVRLEVFSMYPGRSRMVLGHLDAVRVLPLPVSLARFTSYDAYVDCSGLLEDPGFATSHFTDCLLKRLGIAPERVPPEWKRPRLVVPEADQEVRDALDAARSAASGKPLAAFVFRSSYTRTMPDDLAARVLARLAAHARPVVLMEKPGEAARFLQRFGLEEKVLDLSACSTSATRYMQLLAGMDGILSVDTSAVHIGGALGKPTVGLFNSIDLKTRISYSPTVVGIQLDYRGEKCTAPCGRSKSRAFLRGTLPWGEEFYFECGYACDEAVDYHRVFQWMAGEIEKLGPKDPLAFEAIKEEARRRMHSRLAPCWQGLDVEGVVAALVSLVGEEEAKAAEMEKEGRRLAQPA